LRERVETLSKGEVQRQRDELFAQFAGAARTEERPTLSSLQARTQGRIHLVLGPVGAGKSTYGLALLREHGAVRLTLDDWMARLFRPERPDSGVIEWYVERAARAVEQIVATSLGIVESGGSVVLELGLLKATERRSFYRRIDEARIAMSLHFLDAAREIRRERVEERNRSRGATFSMVVPPDVFEMASDLWEPPDPAEHEGRDVRFVRTD
jgi:predicted kinase